MQRQECRKEGVDSNVESVGVLDGRVGGGGMGVRIARDQQSIGDDIEDQGDEEGCEQKVA